MNALIHRVGDLHLNTYTDRPYSSRATPPLMVDAYPYAVFLLPPEISEYRPRPVFPLPPRMEAPLAAS